MAINYSISEMKNPSDPDGMTKFYAKAQSSGIVDIDTLAEDIAYSTSLTDGDVLNVIRALVKQINRHLANGEIVRLEHLGSLQVQIGSKGSESEKDFHDGLIRRVRVQFRPGKSIRNTLSVGNLRFSKVPTLKKRTEQLPEDNEDMPMSL